MTEKNQSAVSLAKKRWENISPKERSDHARMMATVRYAKHTKRDMMEEGHENSDASSQEAQGEV